MGRGHYYTSDMSGDEDVTQILNMLDQDQQASEHLLPLVYNELRRLAADRLRSERAGQTLQATALVHEAYVRLVDSEHQQKWDSRNHFFAAAAESMRRILIENARRKQTIKRGGDQKRIPLQEKEIEAPQSDVDLLALDEALKALEQEDPDAALLVKLRYFSGFTMTQSAEVLDVSTRTAERLWTYAKSWLYDALN